MSQPQSAPPPAIAWQGNAQGQLKLIDQTKLPDELCILSCTDVSTVWEAIKMLRVRGAPAIGIAAAYGVVLSQADLSTPSEEAALKAIEYLAK